VYKYTKKHKTNNKWTDTNLTEIFPAISSLSASEWLQNTLLSIILGSTASSSELSMPHSKAIALAV